MAKTKTKLCSKCKEPTMNKGYYCGKCRKVYFDTWKIKQPDYAAYNREAVKKSNRKHKDTKRKYTRARYNADPCYRLRHCLSTAIWAALKRNGKGKGGSCWNILPYTLAELKQHLTGALLPGMTWQNYGSKWHIDHIKPISWFTDMTPGSGQFLECWSLTNLAPAWKEDNLRKSNKWLGAASSNS